MEADGGWLLCPHPAASLGPPACLSPLQGITRVKNATDAVGVVLKELKEQSHAGRFRLLVAVDGVNALWGRTTLKREDKSLVGKLGFSVLLTVMPARGQNVAWWPRRYMSSGLGSV